MERIIVSSFYGGSNPSINVLKNKMENKKSVMGQVISVFVMILVIAIMVGLTFLFITSLKDNVYDSSERETITVINETGLWINSTGAYLSSTVRDQLGFANPVGILAINGSSKVVNAGNYSLSAEGYLTNLTALTWDTVKLTYTYDRISNKNPYKSVNDTENAGATTVGYLPLIFLALIFGAILTLVLKLILPYINFGRQFGGEY
jgi:hypothetical protein